MKSFKTILLALMVLHCSHEDKHIKVEFLSNKPLFDTILLNGSSILLDEYYNVAIKNTLFDTLFLGLNKTIGTNKMSMRPSRILYLKGQEIVTGELFFVGKPDTIISIPKFNKKNFLFYLPEYSDTLMMKHYSFLFECDSAKILSYRYFDLYSEYQGKPQILKMR